MRHKTTTVIGDQMLRMVGRRIALRRFRVGMSQTELARRCHVTRSQMCKHEAGAAEMPLTRLFEICTVLKVTAGELLNGQE